MDKNGLSSFLLGLGVGVGIGMLFAPKSGQETREIIKSKAGEGTDFIKQRGSELKDTQPVGSIRVRRLLAARKKHLATPWKPANRPIGTQ